MRGGYGQKISVLENYKNIYEQRQQERLKLEQNLIEKAALEKARKDEERMRALSEQKKKVIKWNLTK